MGLIAPHRRWWIALAFAALSLPMLVQVVTPRQTVSAREARTLAPAPQWPQSAAEWRALPKTLEVFLTDHFGLREPLVRTNAVLRYAIESPTNTLVVFGRHRFLFFTGDGMLLQSAGLLQRTSDIEKLADFAAALSAKYQALGIPFLVTFPPNSATITRDLDPPWFKPKPTTEYDKMMRALARRGVPAVDLRPALTAAAAENIVYRRADTHWNKLGALIGFNEAMTALGKPDWRIDVPRVFHGMEEVPGGDLARMLGAPDDIADLDARIDLFPYRPVKMTERKLDTGRATGGNIAEFDHAGPRVVILGDSFTEHAWHEYLGLHASRVTWIHHELCDFTPAVVAAQQPDIVILAMTERLMFCWNLK